MSKGINLSNLGNLLTKGKKFWDEHGDTIMDIAGTVTELVQKNDKKPKE